ncbi:nuclease harbi1-like protein [Elysia marginata]|uniref:Nuclease harbi1-like protein n=1 Tax=Elysia marginata TaxID=1093978 RepID=A0AAV4EYQ7_9GAST|nr:nuclease harbi1-like protein [Elysia marginata]
MEEINVLALQLLLLHWFGKRRQYRRRKYWVHRIFKRRERFGEYHHLVDEILNDEEKCISYLRMRPPFHMLLDMVGPAIEKRTTNFRRPLSSRERLVITLRYPAAGENPPSLSFHFRAGVTTIREIVSETCKVLWRILQPQVMSKPDEFKWKQIASDFYRRFQFPLCLGAIDGKHIRIKKPNKSGSKYYNYKDYFSILLLAITDANGKFFF